MITRRQLLAGSLLVPLALLPWLRRDSFLWEIEHLLAGYKLENGAVERFMKDFNQAYADYFPRHRILRRFDVNFFGVGPYRVFFPDRWQQFRDAACSSFMLSSNFFYMSEMERTHAEIRYLGLYGKRPCSNPFARL